MTDQRKIEVVAYNPAWQNDFAAEAAKIKISCGDLLQKIHHIGSTAIPHMPAKPIIDMVLEFNDITQIKTIMHQLSRLNYLTLSRQVIPARSFFTKKTNDNIGFHLHLYEQGDPQVKRHVSFRDYMVAHPEDAKKYATLKQQLAEQHCNDIFSYVLGKSHLVQAIDAKAKVWQGRSKQYLPANKNTSLKASSKDELIGAITANLNVYMTYFAQYINEIDLIRIPGYTIVNSNLIDMFNFVLDADFTEPTADTSIARVTNYFKEKNSAFTWWTSPIDQPSSLSQYLEKNGYQNTENNIAMCIDLDSYVPLSINGSTLIIVRAEDKKTLHDFALILANEKKAFKAYFSLIAAVLTENDPIEFYVGYVNGKPVVRGLTCYYAGIAGLHWLSTAPDERNKGYGTIMQQYQLQRAKELGYHVAALQTLKQKHALYLNLGFQECGIFKEFKLKHNK